MQRLSRLACSGLLSLLVAVSGNPCAAQGRLPANDLQWQAAQAVAKFLDIDFRPELANNLQLLRTATSLPGSAQLRVVSIRSGGKGARFLRFDCGSRQACLPFYGLLHNSPGGNQLGTKPDSALKSAGLGPPSAGKLVEHTGDRVEVVEELSGLRLRTRAVCLQSGSLGQRIRVRTLTNHRVLLATVAGEQLVRVEH